MNVVLRREDLLGLIMNTNIEFKAHEWFNSDLDTLRVTAVHEDDVWAIAVSFTATECT